MEQQAEKCMWGATTFCLLIGIQLGLSVASAEGIRTVLGRVGGDVMFACDFPSKMNKMKWIKDGAHVHGLRDGTPTKGTGNLVQRSRLDRGNGGYALHVSGLQPSDTGEYKCEVEGTEKVLVQLVLFEVTSISPQYLLVSETISLVLASYPPTIDWDLSITCKNPRNEQKGMLRTTRANAGDRTLRIEKLQLWDSGLWKCQLSTGVGSLELPYSVTVAGIIADDVSPPMLYSRINDTVLLTIMFNVNIRDPTLSHQLEVLSGGLYQSDDPSRMGIEKKTLNITKAGICWSHDCGERAIGVSLSDLSVPLLYVQLTDGGWYTVLVKVRQKELKKRFHLNVLRVWASPSAPVALEGQVDLVCEVSAHTNETVLKWTHVNGSQGDEWSSTGQGSLQITLRMFQERYGVWRCSLHNGHKQLQSADYELVMKRSSAFFDWRIWAAGGAVALALLLLVIICAIVCVVRIRRLRRQAQRRAWLKQQRTCQCKNKLMVPLRP